MKAPDAGPKDVRKRNNLYERPMPRCKASGSSAGHVTATIDRCEIKYVGRHPAEVYAFVIRSFAPNWPMSVLD